MIRVQVRRYRADGTYDKTIMFSHREDWHNRSSLSAWLSRHTEGELERHLQTTPCNIMVRRDGKLISYKELLND